jgi:hypothetical protein
MAETEDDWSEKLIEKAKPLAKALLEIINNEPDRWVITMSLAQIITDHVTRASSPERAKELLDNCVVILMKPDDQPSGRMN